jgi:hypothetical protein
LPARDALSGPTKAPDDPASAFSQPLLDPRVRGPVRTTVTPVRFSALRMRCGEARHADDSLAVSHGRRAAWTRRLNVLAKRVVCRSFLQGPIGETDSIALRNDPSHQAPPLRSFAARSRSCTVALPWRGVPLPARAFAAWPIRVVLPSARIGGAHGVLWRPSQVCSRDRWPIISDRPGPRACSSNRAPRFIFVGLIGRRWGT